MEGIVLGPYVKGYGSSTNDLSQRNVLLTPQSVDDTMNTEVQGCWETPSQPNPVVLLKAGTVRTMRIR